MIKEEYFDVGLKAYNNKNYSKAIDYFNQLIDTFSNSIGEEKLSETYYMRGICYAQEYSIDEALEDFNKAGELGFDKSKIYCGRGIAYAHDGNNKEAISNFNKAIKLNDRYEEAYCRKGIAYFFDLEFDKAIDNFNKTIELNKYYDKAYYYRGLVYYELKEYDKAIKDFDKAIELDNKSILSYNYRGLVYYELKEYDNAIEDFNKAIELDDGFAPPYNNRGMVYLDNNEYDNAIEDFNKAILLYDEFALAYSNRGLVYFDKGEYGKAIEDFNKAIKLNNEFELAYNNRGLVYFYNGKYDKAFNNFKKIYSTMVFYYMVELFLKDKKDINDILKLLNEYTDDYFDFITNGLELEKEEKSKFLQLWIYQYILLDLLSIKNYQNIEEFSHYTSKNIFDKLINYDEEKNKAYLRFTSISKANDPQEGEMLKNLLSINTKKNFNMEETNKGYLVLQTSFIRYTDSLTMFRLYGKDKEREGTGISLVFNNSFFDINELTTISPAQYLGNIKNYGYEKKENKLPLYFILYYDKDKNELIYNPTDSIYENKIIKLNNICNEDIEYDKNNSNIINNIKFVLKNIFIIIRDLKNEELELAYKLLINIRYLIKHSAFFEEQELRIIKLTKNDDSDVLFDKDINRLYSNYEIPIFEENYLKKVIIGPKIENAPSLKEVYQHLIMKNKSNKDIDIEISELPLN